MRIIFFLFLCSLFSVVITALLFLVLGNFNPFLIEYIPNFVKEVEIPQIILDFMPDLILPQTFTEFLPVLTVISFLLILIVFIMLIWGMTGGRLGASLRGGAFLQNSLSALENMRTACIQEYDFLFKHAQNFMDEYFFSPKKIEFIVQNKLIKEKLDKKHEKGKVLDVREQEIVNKYNYFHENPFKENVTLSPAQETIREKIKKVDMQFYTTLCKAGDWHNLVPDAQLKAKEKMEEAIKYATAYEAYRNLHERITLEMSSILNGIFVGNTGKQQRTMVRAIKDICADFKRIKENTFLMNLNPSVRIEEEKKEKSKKTKTPKITKVKEINSDSKGKEIALDEIQL